MAQFVNLQAGDPAPWFHQRSPSNPRYAFDTVAGRYVVLSFLGTAGDAVGQRAVAAVEARKALFDDQKASFFAVTADARDESEKRLDDKLPGRRVIFDFDGSVSRLYGAAPVDGTAAGGTAPVRRLWLVLDPTLRVLKTVAFRQDGSDASEVLDYVAALPPPSRFAGFEISAPVLILPNVFEPEFCQHLIELYTAHGGEESGFMNEVDGKTVLKVDAAHKRRRDYHITDPALVKQTHVRLSRRIAPEIKKVHQFTVTRVERCMVGCYTDEDGGHFRAHRDNTTKGTAHRRFAVSINLNSDFDGGEVSFPEYGPRGYKPPPGGAVVFSCSLLHAVSKVTRGRRYAFLPFLYDDEAAKIREANNQYLGEGVGEYRQAKAQ